MIRCVVILVTLSVFCQAIKPGPLYPPTKGEVWPKPQYEKKEKTIYSVDKNKLVFEVTQKTCQILTDAIDRAKKAVHKFPIIEASYGDDWKFEANSNLSSVTVELTMPCESYPYFGMDESYNLTVSTTATLKSASIWGILHGLESFLHLIYLSDDYKTLLIAGTEIQDYPRHPHRGLLLDTSRHYFTVANILTTLDAMAMNKFNVFHWHIVDDPSFPYQSEKFPELSEKGAYHPSMVYTKADIEKIIEYGKDRAIRVMPEIDVPGHVRSWGEAHPQILTECYSNNKVESLGPMDPTKNQTYMFLGQFLEEVRLWFPDKYLHLGGDEVDMRCWASNPAILDYMLKHNMSSVVKLHAVFMEQTVPLVKHRRIIVWEEVFNESVPLPDDTVIQAWRMTNGINKVVESGKDVVYSTDYYLSELNGRNGDWQKFYTPDPRGFVKNKTLVHKVLGGEACMWGEYVDDRNFLQRIWPRASAVAERLWSEASRDKRVDPTFSESDPTSPESDAKSQLSEDMALVSRRLEEHACRMLRRGVPAQPPNGPGFCIF